jgi:ankyrin repeat protein
VTRLAAAAAVLLVAAGCGGGSSEAPPRDLDGELLEAAYRNDVEAARRLIDEGADVNAKDETQQSAYLIATSEVGDDPRLLELTLGAGADVNAKDSYNGTGLIRAAERGYPRVIRRLLETDVEVDHVNRLGWTALLEAVILGEGGPPHVETVRLLVDAGADATIPDESGTTALQHARRQGFSRIERLLRGVP